MLLPSGLRGGARSFGRRDNGKCSGGIPSMTRFPVTISRIHPSPASPPRFHLPSRTTIGIVRRFPSTTFHYLFHSTPPASPHSPSPIPIGAVSATDGPPGKQPRRGPKGPPVPPAAHFVPGSPQDPLALCPPPQSTPEYAAWWRCQKKCSHRRISLPKAITQSKFQFQPSSPPHPYPSPNSASSTVTAALCYISCQAVQPFE